jgi:pyruvyltransferase
MLNAFWFINHNLGDNLNHYLLSRLAKNGVVFTSIDSPLRKVIAIGTILGWCNETTTAWGPGIGNADDCVNPAAFICAVRGPRSYKRAIESGCKLERVFGDPALLLPLIYHPPQRKKHAVGVVAHYVDQQIVFQRYGHESREILLIDVLDVPERVVDAIASCERIISSSLHGVIVAHAYGIPAAWVSFSDKIGGDGTKYHDYFESVGCTVDGCVRAEDLPPVTELLARCRRQTELEPKIDIGPLLQAAPFELSGSLMPGSNRRTP